MIRAGRAAILTAALVAASSCGGDGSTTTPTSSGPSNSTRSPATLGLTPIEPDRTDPDRTDDEEVTTLDSLLSIEPVSTFNLTSLVSVTGTDGLPIPEPAPLPDAFEYLNQIGYLEIPALSMAEKFYEGVTLTTLNNGPGHWPGSALPGQTGNVVVAGHRVSHSHPFRDLDKLELGDEVVFSTPQGRNVYAVSKVEVVEPDALWIVTQTSSKTATLFACHPKGTTKQRIVAFLDYVPERSQPAA